MPRPNYDEVVLLTGLPSFGARKVCEELVRDPDRKTLVHAIVHPKLSGEARAFLDELPMAERARVEPVEGDAGAMDLGLSGEEWKRLAREVDRIHHCAAVSYLGVDRATAEYVNVGGAREILELAGACEHLQCLVHHSTALVSGDRTGMVYEADLQRGQRFRNAVEETRARAEKRMRAAMDRIPIAVVRPSIVVGDSTTGEIDRFDGPYLLVLLIVTSPAEIALPLPGRGDVPLNMVPADYVAKAAVLLGRDERARGRTFHVVDPAPLTARRVFELVALAGGRRLPRGFIPANLTKALLRTPGLERFAKSPRAFLDALATPVTYASTNADELLADAGLRCPPFESYVERLVDFVRTRLKERKERREAASEVEDPLG
jgi:thioester reductase-like protein